jgi:hypothetical protein
LAFSSETTRDDRRAESFLVTKMLGRYEDGRRVFSKTWSKTIPRDHV